MNKEIESIINHYINNDVARDKVKDYIEELQEKINTYENPDDLTLMFMYCDEKAKDKIKALQERIEYLERSNNRREETIELERKENLELHNKIDKLEDELNWYKQECDDLEMSGGVGE